jgi:hypothetical protein
MRKGLLALMSMMVAAPALLGALPAPASASAGQAAIADAARQGQYVFILFSREDDAATQTVRQTLNAALAKRNNPTTSVEVHVSDPTAKPLVDQYGVSRAPMPLVMAIAPNGAVTGAFPLKLTEAQVAQAFASPAVAQCLKAIQARKLVLLCVQPKPGTALPQGVRDFQADPQYRPASEVVTIRAGDTAEAPFLKRLQVPVPTLQPVTVLIAPPGTALGTFTGEISKEQLTEKLKASKSCCPGGCCPGGCCGPNGCSPAQR